MALLERGQTGSFFTEIDWVTPPDNSELNLYPNNENNNEI